MIEKMLQFVADTIDGKLVVCDDGFVIEVKSSSLWLKTTNADGTKAWASNQGAGGLKAVSGVKLLFNENGSFETIQYC